MSVHGTVFDGFVYLERRKDGFVAWSAGREKVEDMDSPAVRVVASADSRGTRLEIRRVMTRRTRAGVVLLSSVTGILVLVAGALPLLGASLGLPWLLSTGLLLVVLWRGMAAQWSTSTDRSNRAWNELSSAVIPLALPEGETPGPYRE